jgi:XTP/dITP diphosphohydrolase
LKLYCATKNPGKLREFQAEPLPNLDSIPPCEETGTTFEENATQKALYYSAFTPEWVFADDSGLAVAALNGAPGVFSARFAGEAATDEANNRLLVEKLRDISDRRARYICVIALARRSELIKTFRGEVEGAIVDHPRGSHGFGYDPYFYYPPFGCTFGEASAEDKQKVSHRGKALRAMREYLALQNARP